MALNIISFSLWGDSPKYWNGAFENVKLAKEFFPDFICRFYIDKNCDSSMIDRLGDSGNVQIIIMDPDKTWHGMFWRFYAAGETDGIFLSRDTDSRLGSREYFAIKEWLDSDKLFHIMRDHPYHGVSILGGMWGCRNGILKDISQYIETWRNHTSKKGEWKDVSTAGDQNFLGEVIYPMVYRTSLEHSEFGLRGSNPIYRFPTARNNYEFVGEVYDENNVRNPEHWKIIRSYDIR